jgi:cellulose synthase/poly-beta-1,6-N-acetylglucosamine synthase-like glycosyltransferase
MTEPFVSVVIATRNRAALLAETLEALAAQTWPRDRFEIVVADNDSSDGTFVMVDAARRRPEAPEIRYLHVATRGKSHAVNAALKEARGDLLALTDDDVLPEPGWIAGVARAFDDPRVDFVAGRIVPRWEVAPPSWMSPALYGVLAVPDNGDVRRAIRLNDDGAVIPIGANMAMRKAVVDRIGGLRADLGKLEGTLRTGEDHELFLRMLHAGYRGSYEPSALVRHFVPRARLVRSYFRRWLHQNGRDVAKLEAVYTTGLRRLLGVPRYLWRQAIVDALTAIRATLAGDARRRFASALRLLWFAGYLRESWFGAPEQPVVHHGLAVGS